MSASKRRIFHKLLLAAHRVGKEADAEVGSVSGLTVAQSAVLSVLENFDDVTQKKVARELGQNESAVTAMVNRLIRLGFVTRKRSPHDARAWQLHMTRKGKTALDRIKPPFSRINRRIDSVLSPDEVENLADYLQRLNDAFADL